MKLAHAVVAAAVVLLLAVAYAYENCKFGLNKHLPAKWQKACHPSADGFVGPSLGRAPGMRKCLVQSGGQHPFNRCTWV
jgi:hypothetical protein